MLPMRDGRDGTSEDRATQLLICEKLSLATMFSSRNCLKYSQVQVQNFTIFKAFLVTCMLLWWCTQFLITYLSELSFLCAQFTLLSLFWVLCFLLKNIWCDKKCNTWSHFFSLRVSCLLSFVRYSFIFCVQRGGGPLGEKPVCRDEKTLTQLFRCCCSSILATLPFSWETETSMLQHNIIQHHGIRPIICSARFPPAS